MDMAAWCIVNDPAGSNAADGEQTCRLYNITVLFAQRLQANARGEPSVQKLCHQLDFPVHRHRRSGAMHCRSTRDAVGRPAGQVGVQKHTPGVLQGLSGTQ